MLVYGLSFVYGIAAMLLFLLSLGGIPFVVGFWAKLYVFWAAAQQGLYWLVLVGAILTVVALFYYLLVAKRMYIDAPDTPAPVTARRFCCSSRSSSAWPASSSCTSQPSRELDSGSAAGYWQP